MMITNAELGDKQLDDFELRNLELELRTGGSLNVRQLLRAVIELQKLREFDTERVAELEDELDELRVENESLIDENKALRKVIP